MEVVDVVVDLSVASIGGLIVKAFVESANYTGVPATIAGIFVFAVLAFALLGGLKKLKGK